MATIKILYTSGYSEHINAISFHFANDSLYIELSDGTPYGHNTDRIDLSCIEELEIDCIGGVNYEG